jgi:protein SFI1
LPAELFQRNEEHLDAIAETFMETKDRVVQRRIMTKWVHRANQAQAAHDQLQILAENFDRAKLTRNTWVIWRERLDNIRLDRDWKAKKGVYTAMEQTAVRERELNLKWVALSHWRAVAEDEQQRTSVARRHIMRKRYFQAWSNITALNELKIRRFVLSRFFAKWQGRLQQVQAQNEEALVTRDIELLRRIYWKWFYTFGNKVAPNMHNRRIERQFFNTWRDRLQLVWEQDQQAEQRFFVGVEGDHFVSWRAKAQELLRMSRTAEDFRNRKLLARVLATWRREAVLAPRAAQLTHRVNVTLHNAAFQTWRTLALQSRQAFQTDQRRILRNAFTAWNDRLRINFLQGQIELRLKSETIYKWRIAAQSSAACHNYDHKLASNTLQLWLNKAQNRHRSIEGAEATFAASQRRRTLRSGLRGFEAALEHQRQLEDEAANFRHTRLLYGAFAKWRQRSADVDILNRKANAAEFYLLTTKTLKRWSHSTEEHRKYRKREAYSQIRRLCKMNLAREMLRRMQIQLAHVRNLDHYSLEFQEDHVVSRTVSTFRSWKQRAAIFLEQKRQAEVHYNSKLTAAVLQKMVQRKNQLQDMATQARELSAGSAGVEAMNCLRKLDRRLFQIKGQEQWAVALREKHGEKHVKNMLRYWLEQASSAQRQRVGGRVDEDVFGTSTMTAPAIDDLTVFDHTAWNLDPLDLHLDEFRHTAHEEVDTTFIDNDGIITSTPLPGYLRTPSKRNTARAKARERLAASNARITTGRMIRFADQVPATAPPRQQSNSAPPVLPSPSGPSITPFERKLREQGYTSPSVHGRRTPARGGFGTSRFGASADLGRFGVNTPARSTFAGFEDIPEVSEDRSRGF